MGGLGVFLGLSSLTVTLLKAEGVVMPWLPEARGTLLALAALWSLWLGGRMLIVLPGASRAARLTALACLALSIAGIVLPWIFLFYLW